jgi:hypothetical protein
MLTVIVTGGRDYADREALYKVLDKLHSAHHVTLIIEGGASGADALASAWAKERKVPTKRVKADWERHGNAAGPIRNKQMLERFKPDAVVAFDGGVGTADCVEQAVSRGIYCFGPGMAGAVALIKQRRRAKA